MNTITITINGDPHTVHGNTSLADLLQVIRPGLNPATAPLATAVNGRHVPRQQRQQCLLNDQDAITTFEPISGG